MANRVNVNITASDLSRSGLSSLRRQMDRTRRDIRRAGGDVRFTVRVDPGGTRAEMRRLRREVRRAGGNLVINPRLSPTPSPLTLRQRLRRALGRSITVPLRVSRRGFLATLRGPLRALGGLASGMMQDGIGQGIINGFKAGGPVGIAVLAGLLISMVAFLGAALSGLIVTALGAAFVGVGVASAAMSDQIKGEWTDTLAVMKKLFADVGTPLIPVLSRALDTLESMARRAAPQLKKAIEETAPATEKFIQSLMKGFESFGKTAFKPIMDAWNVFAPVFGEQWNEFMRELGGAFGEMADLVKKHPTEIAAALEGVFEILTFLIDIVTFFGKVWVFTLQNAGDAVGFLLQTAQGMAMVILGVFDGIISGAAKAFGWIPGVGDDIKGANRAFDSFRNEVVSDLEEMANKAYGWDNSLNQANRKRTLQADIASWQAKLTTARRDLKKTTNQKARAKLTANIADLENKVARARAQLNALNGKTATTYVRTYQYTSVAAGTARSGLAHGGISRAATGGARNNMTLVGEQGPELVDLAPGSHVRSNSDSRRLMRGGGGGGATVLKIESGGSRIDDLLVWVLRNAIRKGGGSGDVQMFLGGRKAAAAR